MPSDLSADLPSLAAAPAEVRVEFQAWLDQVDDELIGGALVVIETLPRVTAAFLAGDHDCIAEARSLAADVRERCRNVEEQGFLMLAREGPVSGDLRRLVSILRLVNDLERAGRLMTHVAESVERMDPRTLPPEVRTQLEELAHRSIEVFRRGVDAWRRRDGLAVHDLDRLDTGVDRLRTGLLLRAGDLEGPPDIVVLLGLLARFFERFADHGVAFARHVTFVVTGERVDVGT